MARPNHCSGVSAFVGRVLWGGGVNGVAGPWVRRRSMSASSWVDLRVPCDKEAPAHEVQ